MQGGTRSHEPSIDLAIEAGDWPTEERLRELAEAAVSAAVTEVQPQVPFPPSGSELSILFTDDARIRQLNAEWRGEDKPTNVLSFPQAPGPHSGPLLGDIILAYETVRDEAALAGKPLEAHMAHLIVHGFLHLLGYDHEDEAEAEEMEALERAALDRIGIADPYAPAQE